MKLGATEREALFGTSILSHQMQLDLLKRPGYRAGGKDLREVFSDLSKAAFSSVVISLQTRGIVVIEGKDVIILPEKASIPGVILDRCWKAMRIEGNFTVESIVNLTGYTPVQVREAIRQLLKQEAVKVIFKKPRLPAVYKVVTSEVVRPATRRERQPCSMVQKAWYLIRRLASFSFADISAICGMSSRYAKELVQSFKKAGYLEEIGIGADGHTKLYKLKEGAPEEPPMVKNRTRIKRKGY